MSMTVKLLRSLRRDGLARTIVRCFQYPRIHLRLEKLQRALSTRDPRVIFSTIHDANLWSDQESVSGPGSSLEYTKNLRERLPRLLQEFGVQKLYDAPCGDFNWMREVDLQTQPVEYHGADVVSRIIDNNRVRFAGPLRRFDVADIISSPFPAAGMWFCRDCLFHFSYADIFRTLSVAGQQDPRESDGRAVADG